MVRSSPLPSLIDPLGGSIDQVPVPVASERRPGIEQKASAVATPDGAKQPKIPSVLRTKIQAPPLRTSTLSRQRLLDRLATATQNRVTLVTADAGYGKTTLLADFSRRFDGTSLWYSLDATDGDWQTVITHLLASIREANPDFGEATAALLRSEPGMPPPKAAATGSLLQELQAFAGERTVLILDDVHSIEESREAKELLARVMRDAPGGFSFVLTSRHRPSISLARWAGMGELAELTTDDLRFSLDETERLFHDSFGQPLESDVLRELDARMRGWAACLQLFSTLINGQSATSVRAIIHSLSGAAGPLYEYLAQEVVAHVSPELQSFLTRASLLQPVTPDLLEALFPAERRTELEALMAEADALGLLSRAGQSGMARQFHPLLRDFLNGELRRRLGESRIAELHADVARAAEADSLTAAHHYIEAGMPEEAMRCLGRSSLQTMGSGRWGTAARLAARLEGQPASGAVAAIQGRRLLEEGDLVGAAQILGSVDLAAQEPNVRAVIRHTLLSLGWRSGDSQAIVGTLKDILADDETPPLMRDIAQVFLDSSPHSDSPASLAELSARLQRMAKSQGAAGYDYYAAISLHNSSICALFAGQVHSAMELAGLAIAAFEALPGKPPELFSAHAHLAAVLLEAGNWERAQEHIRLSQATGREHADVPAEFAYDFAIIGQTSQAHKFLLSAEELRTRGHSDVVADSTANLARALLALQSNPPAALTLLSREPPQSPLDLGYGDQWYVLNAAAHLLMGNRQEAVTTIERGQRMTRVRGNRRCQVRLSILNALAKDDLNGAVAAIHEASATSALALAELADVLGKHLDVFVQLPADVEASISLWPDRWRPVLRRQLDLGDDPRARQAASLLDRFGSLEDVGRLRAFGKTYRKRGASPSLGKELGRRVSPRLEIKDLGPVSVVVGDRLIELGRTRRKPAALLMYLVTRPNFTATREQILEDLWPDVDTAAGLNSLNQSLYFIRREIDPWYEDDLSPEYLPYQAELVSIDPRLAQVCSADFLSRCRQRLALPVDPQESMSLLDAYRGQFCPEFEYEDWAIPWRVRVHAAFLDLAKALMFHFVKHGDYRPACDVALRVLSVDPTADDIEQRLIWLYWRSGARSAAEAHYNALAARERADGFDPVPLRDLVAANPMG